MREIITLQCPECKNRNYSTTKNKKTTTGRLEFSKFCNTCRKHTAITKRPSNQAVGAGARSESCSRPWQSAGSCSGGSKLNG